MTELEMRGGWEQIWKSGDIPPRYRAVAAPNAAVVAWAGHLPAGGFVLDIGCGVGRHVVWLGEQGFRMAGVDVSPTGIAMTQEVAAERGIDFDGHVTDFTRLPWPENTFDGALATSAIHHHRRGEIVRALAEVWRVLKPGGLFIADFPHTGTMAYAASRRDVAAGILTEVEPNTFVDERPEANPMEDEFLPHHFCDEADLRDLMQRFEIVQLWGDLQEIEREGVRGLWGKWVVWGRKVG